MRTTTLINVALCAGLVAALPRPSDVPGAPGIPVDNAAVANPEQVRAVQPEAERQVQADVPAPQNPAHVGIADPGSPQLRNVREALKNLDRLYKLFSRPWFESPEAEDYERFMKVREEALERYKQVYGGLEATLAEQEKKLSNPDIPGAEKKDSEAIKAEVEGYFNSKPNEAQPAVSEREQKVQDEYRKYLQDKLNDNIKALQEAHNAAKSPNAAHLNALREVAALRHSLATQEAKFRSLYSSSTSSVQRKLGMQMIEDLIKLYRQLKEEENALKNAIPANPPAPEQAPEAKEDEEPNKPEAPVVQPAQAEQPQEMPDLNRDLDGDRKKAEDVGNNIATDEFLERLNNGENPLSNNQYPPLRDLDPRFGYRVNNRPENDGSSDDGEESNVRPSSPEEKDEGTMVDVPEQLGEQPFKQPMDDNEDPGETDAFFHDTDDDPNEGPKKDKEPKKDQEEPKKDQEEPKKDQEPSGPPQPENPSVPPQENKEDDSMMRSSTRFPGIPEGLDYSKLLTPISNTEPRSSRQTNAGRVSNPIESRFVDTRARRNSAEFLDGLVNGKYQNPENRPAHVPNYIANREKMKAEEREELETRRKYLAQKKERQKNVPAPAEKEKPINQVELVESDDEYHPPAQKKEGSLLDAVPLVESEDDDGPGEEVDSDDEEVPRSRKFKEDLFDSDSESDTERQFNYEDADAQLYWDIDDHGYKNKMFRDGRGPPKRPENKNPTVNLDQNLYEEPEVALVKEEEEEEEQPVVVREREEEPEVAPGRKEEEAHPGNNEAQPEPQQPKPKEKVEPGPAIVTRPKSADRGREREEAQRKSGLTALLAQRKSVPIPPKQQKPKEDVQPPKDNVPQKLEEVQPKAKEEAQPKPKEDVQPKRKEDVLPPKDNNVPVQPEQPKEKKKDVIPPKPNDNVPPVLPGPNDNNGQPAQPQQGIIPGPNSAENAVANLQNRFNKKARPIPVGPDNVRPTKEGRLLDLAGKNGPIPEDGTIFGVIGADAEPAIKKACEEVESKADEAAPVPQDIRDVCKNAGTPKEPSPVKAQPGSAEPKYNYPFPRRDRQYIPDYSKVVENNLKRGQGQPQETKKVEDVKQLSLLDKFKSLFRFGSGAKKPEETPTKTPEEKANEEGSGLEGMDYVWQYY